MLINGVRESKDLSSFLLQLLQERKKRNSRYSLRALAKSLDVDHSTLSQILRRRRRLTPVVCNDICQKLKLPSTVQQKFLDKALRSNSKQMVLSQLQQDLFLITSHWLYDAILEQTKADAFELNEKKIANDFQESPKRILACIEKLKKFKMLVDADGKWIDASGDNSLVFEGETIEAMRAYQKSLVKKSFQAINEVSKAERDHTSLVTLMHPSLVKDVQKKIRDFRRELARFIETKKVNKKSKSVYAIQFSAFPLTGARSKK